MTEFTNTYQPANEARSAGQKKRKILTEALIAALHREAEDADGKLTKRLNLIADKLVTRALDGDVPALREVFDRTDGKVPQALVGEDEGPIKQVLEVTWKSSAAS